MHFFLYYSSAIYYHIISPIICFMIICLQQYVFIHLSRGVGEEG